MKLPTYISRAIKCGITPKVRNWRKLSVSEMTRAEKVMAFIEAYCKTPEGAQVGKPLKLALFQEVFIYALYDNPHTTTRAILSIGRKNGKSGLIAALLLVHIISTESTLNSQIVAAALSREQSALIFKLAQKMVMQSPILADAIKITPSQKILTGLSRNVEFKAIAKDSSGGSTMGLSPVMILLDESGQIRGAFDDFVNALTTSQGAHENPIFITISTQSASDADYLSVMIDDSILSQDKHTVCHVYEADKDKKLTNKLQAKYANPALGIFRSEKDLFEQLKRAERLPSEEAKSRNLLLNQRIALESLFLSPNVWMKNNSTPDMGEFVGRKVILGLDLSKRNDLTAATLSCKDDNGFIHVIPFVFCPSRGIEDRSRRDRTPYNTWVNQGHLIPLGGDVMDYDQIATYLDRTIKEMDITVDFIEFDRWKIEDFQSACKRVGAFQGSEWHSVGQGFMSMGPRCDCLLNAMIDAKVKHGNHPLLTMAASNAIAVQDPTGAIKLDKSKSTQRIDPLIAMLMSVYPLLDGESEDESQIIDIEALIA